MSQRPETWPFADQNRPTHHEFARRADLPDHVECSTTPNAADLFALRKPGNIYTRIMNPARHVRDHA